MDEGQMIEAGSTGFHFVIVRLNADLEVLGLSAAEISGKRLGRGGNGLTRRRVAAPSV